MRPVRPGVFPALFWALACRKQAPRRCGTNCAVASVPVFDSLGEKWTESRVPYWSQKTLQNLGNCSGHSCSGQFWVRLKHLERLDIFKGTGHFWDSMDLIQHLLFPLYLLESYFDFFESSTCCFFNKFGLVFRHFLERVGWFFSCASSRVRGVKVSRRQLLISKSFVFREQLVPGLINNFHSTNPHQLQYLGARQWPGRTLAAQNESVCLECTTKPVAPTMRTIEKLPPSQHQIDSTCVKLKQQRNIRLKDWFWWMGWLINWIAICTRIAPLLISRSTWTALELIWKSQAKRCQTCCRHEHLNRYGKWLTSKLEISLLKSWFSEHLTNISV